MNFLKMLFDLNLYRKSFKVPILKIVGSALVMLIVCALRISFTIKNPTLNISISLVAIIITVASIMCLFVGAVEALQVSQNKKNMRDR